MKKEKGYENARPCYCGFSECMFHDQGTVDDDGMVGIEMCRLGMYEIPENEIKNAGIETDIVSPKLLPDYTRKVNAKE